MDYTYKNNSGNLLMNVVVALGIIAMLTAVTIPNLRKYQTDLTLNGAAKNLTSDLRYAQQSTITEQTAHIAQFDIDARDYSILKTGISTTTIKTVALPANVSFETISSNLNNQVIFNSFGGVSQAGQIILKNSDNKTSTINVKPSGYIELAQ